MTSSPTHAQHASLLGRLVIASTPAGPAVSPTAAAGAVARLRKAVLWADPYLAELTGLTHAAHNVTQQRALIVDRRGAIELMDNAIAHILGPSYAPLANLGRALALRALSGKTLGTWDPIQSRRVLFAPNILTTANTHALDQQDFARWAALRTGLWATHLNHAPHLVDYLADLARDLTSSAREFTQLVVLLCVLPSVEMERLTPKDLPSINWIRQYRAGSAWIHGLSLLPTLRLTNADTAILSERATAFARTVIATQSLPTLLQSVIALPTAQELATPTLWCERMGIPNAHA